MRHAEWIIWWGYKLDYKSITHTEQRKNQRKGLNGPFQESHTCPSGHGREETNKFGDSETRGATSERVFTIIEDDV